MKPIDRRALTRGLLCGGAVAVAGFAASRGTASAMPLDDRIPGALEERIEKTQAWVGPPPRRRPRRRVSRCWWRRGRRVCGWRWV
jgi:hypothetical protein